MKKFVLMHFGFENPTPEIMDAWNAWFESIADKTVENVGFSGGREISKSETRDLPWDMESITGFSVIEARVLMLRKNLPKPIRLLRAFESTK